MMNTPGGSYPDGPHDSTNPDNFDGLSALEMLDKAADLPFGEQEQDMLHRALQVAQDTADEDAEYRIRLALSASHNFVDDTQGLLTHFSAAVGFHDRDPARFPGQSDGSYPDLFWMYKTALSNISTSVLFSRDQVDGLLDQMDFHFHRAGVPQIAVDIERRDDALLNGTIEQATQLQELIDASTVDDPFDDCPTCKLAGRFDVAMRASDHATARDILMEILEIGPIGCVMEPETSLAAFMLQALKEGDEEFAHFAQVTSASSNSSFQSMNTVGRHLEFLGITGNYARGLGLLTRYQNRLISDPLSTQGHFGFYLGAFVLLSTTERAGFGDVTVAGSASAFGQDSDLTVTALKEVCLTLSTELAQRYDERNGTDNFIARLKRSHEHAALDIPLDMGSTNLLLRAQTATHTPPATDVERVERYIVAKNQGALHDAAELLRLPATLEDLDALDLPDPERLAYLFAAADEVPGALIIAELRRQGVTAADFLEGTDLTAIHNVSLIDAPSFRTEAERLRPHDLRSWIILTRAAAQALLSSNDSAAQKEAVQLFSEIERATANDPAFAHFNRQMRLALLGVDVETGTFEDAPARYRALRDEMPWLEKVGLDLFYARNALTFGFDDGLHILDQLLGTFITYGMRETTAKVAMMSANLLVESGRIVEAVERARLGVAELQAAGLPSRDAELMLGELLAYVHPDESRETLEQLLLPKLHDRDAATFSPEEIEGLIALGRTLIANGPDSVDVAAWTLLQARDLALESALFDAAVRAGIAFSEAIYGHDSQELAITELRATLPAAMALDDDHESEIALRDRIAINQSELDDPAALDTLAESMDRATTDNQRIYVQETMNRVLFTFGRLDECLDGCRTASTLVLTLGHASGAAQQLEQGAGYAFQAGEPLRGAELLEEAHSIGDLPPEQSYYYATNLADIYSDLGKNMKARKWRKRAEELETLLGEG